LSSIAHSSPCIDASDCQAVADVLASGMIARGREVTAFEREVGEFLDRLPGVATSSGTGALVCALRALEIGPGDEVVIPTYVCSAVWHAVVATGATPRLCDVDDDWCVTAETVLQAMSPRTRAVIVVHTFGIPADRTIQARAGVPVIDDCCQALGLPSSACAGNICVVSFHATKMLTTGEGGMALTSDRALAQRMRTIAAAERDQLSDLQAALGRSQLRRYPGFLARRRAQADYYCEALASLPISLPRRWLDESLFFRFPLRIAGDVDRIRAEFAALGVQVRRGVDALLHRAVGPGGVGFPKAERLFDQTVSIPLYPAMSEADAARVVAAAERVLPSLGAT
jgi:UDP-4-amino-4-deoxy-L-arabinose-oxoglutarate aminotransferase